MRLVPKSVDLKKDKTRSHRRAGLLGSMRICAGIERVYVVAAACVPRKLVIFIALFAHGVRMTARLGLTTAFLAYTVRLSVHVRTAPGAASFSWNRALQRAGDSLVLRANRPGRLFRGPGW